jgi:hypothetical protein
MKVSAVYTAMYLMYIYNYIQSRPYVNWKVRTSVIARKEAAFVIYVRWLRRKSEGDCPVTLWKVRLK